MDRLSYIQVFVEVARARSFTAAARHLGMSRAAVTKHVAALERLMDAQLLSRSTQHVGLTEAGARLLDGGARLLGEFEALEAGVRDAVSEPRGLVRVGTPPAFGAAHLVPAVAAFTARQPQISVSLLLDDGTGDLVRDGLDMSLRIAPALRDASYIARLLLEVPQLLVASPAYIEAHGMPREPAELTRHNCLVHALKAPTDTWHFGRVAVRVRGSTRSNFGEALRSAALLGYGIAMHPIYMVDEDLREGRLRRVLPDWEPTRLRIYAIYPRRDAPARVRSLIDFLGDWLPREARWLHPAGGEQDRGAATDSEAQWRPSARFPARD